MTKPKIWADLVARGQGRCLGAMFAGDILGQEHKYEFGERRVTVRLPPAEFEAGSADPKGKFAPVIHSRQHRSANPTPATSYYEVEYLIVEIELPEAIRIPQSLLEHSAVRMSPTLRSEERQLNKLSEQYDSLLAAAWLHWMRVARWATNEHSIGLPGVEIEGSPDLAMSRLYDTATGHGVWTSPASITLMRSVQINAKKWAHIGRVLSGPQTPPIWIEYLVEGRHRLANRDYSGCVLSSAIACETMARAAFSHLVGSPANAGAAELVDRTAAQAIVGRWEALTGLKAEGSVHKLFDTRNRLVHSGRTDIVDEKIASTAYKAACGFVEGGDEWWFVQQRLANPRTTCPVDS